MQTSSKLKACVAMAAALFMGTSAFAATMAKTDYNTQKTQIKADYKVDKVACDKFTKNEKDVCEKKAEGKEKVALAELEMNYTGKPKDATKLAMVKADTAYETAKEMCDDKSGNDKDVCVKEAKATHTKAQADAKMNKEVTAAHKEANDDKRDADYKVAAEKCDAMSGDAKSSCMAAAKAKYGKS